MESKYNSKSNPWGYESFQVKYETLEEWFQKIHKFERIDKMARKEGKIVSYQTYIGEDGVITTDVVCQ